MKTKNAWWALERGGLSDLVEMSFFCAVVGERAGVGDGRRDSREEGSVEEEAEKWG